MRFRKEQGGMQLAEELGFNWNRLIVLSLHLETVKESRRNLYGLGKQRCL